jgi:DNA polymerase-1
MNQEIQNIFNSLGNNKVEEKVIEDVNSRVLIIDSLNAFLRAFTAIGWVNKDLSHIGGLTGFLRSLGYVNNLVRPTRIILVFDGQGGSTNKKYIYPEYKANRGLKRVTNWDMFENQQDESESITSQIIRLIQYLKQLPVDLISIDKIEADDVIGYIAKKLKGDITIVSSDKDYLQLVSDNITVYSPIKKKFYTKQLVLKEYGVTPENFLTQKVLLGDDGDNVPGVKGLGSKTMLKLFPDLGTENLIGIDDILEVCNKENKKMHISIKNYEYQLRINKRLMDLKDPNIPEEAEEEINSMLLNPFKVFNSKEFIQLYNEDQLGNTIPNLQNWLFTHFNNLQKYN